MDDSTYDDEAEGEDKAGDATEEELSLIHI